MHTYRACRLTLLLRRRRGHAAEHRRHRGRNVGDIAQQVALALPLLSRRLRARDLRLELHAALLDG